MSAPRPQSLREHRILLSGRLLRLWYPALASALPPAPPPHWTLYTLADGPPRPQPIPRTIWSYWTGGEPPQLVQRCVAHWRRLNPGYDLHVLSDATLGQHIAELPPGLHALDAPRRADWIRLELLRRFGGIWLDASVCLTQPLDWVQRAQHEHRSDFVGFYLEGFTSDPRYPVVENWFMAAPPGSPLIDAWHREFTLHALPRSGRQYVEYLQEVTDFATLRQRIGYLDYLSMHLALQRVLRLPTPCRLSLQRAEDGPFFYHALSRWRNNALRRNYFFRPANAALPAVLKLRGFERRIFDLWLGAGLAAPDSLIQRGLPPVS